MSNLEERLLEYFTNPESADLNSVLRATIAEVRSLRKQLAESQKINEKQTEMLTSFTETMQRKNQLIKRLEKHTEPQEDEELDDAVHDMPSRQDKIEGMVITRAEFAKVAVETKEEPPVEATEPPYKGGRPHKEAKKSARAETRRKSFRYTIIRKGA